MSVYLKDLYKNIIQKNKNYEKLRILTGYASASFLKKVINEYHNLKLELYIGMSQQGISLNNHKEFCDIMSKYDNIEIYYQVKDRNNHMKMIVFSNDLSEKVIVGSANFTENGFISNQEIMVESVIETSKIFKKQKDISLLCNSKNINEFIEFYTDDSFEFENSTYIESEPSESEPSEEEQKNIETFKKLKMTPNPLYFENFKVELVLDKEHNPTWSEKGINAWVKNKNPYLQSPQKVYFQKYFPNEDEFIIYTDDGRKFLGRLSGKFKSEIHFNDDNIYSYIKNRIGLKEDRPISRDDLIKYGCTTFYFTRVEEYIYIVEFKN